MGEEMARLTLEGTLKKNRSGTLPRISQALHDLLNSLDKFRELENILGLETAAEADHTCSTVSQTSEAKPSFLRLVVATLKGMVVTLVSEIEAKPEIQKLLMLIQKSGIAANDCAFLHDAVSTKQPSCQVDTNPKPCLLEVTCTADMDSKTVKRVLVETGQVGCRHTCEHHPELMDRSLWSTLPQELVELVLARLPMQQLVELCRCSNLWSIMSKSSDFRRECSKRHPKLFGLVGWKEHPGRTVCTVVYDIKSNEWSYRELGGPTIWPEDRHAYDDSMYACDGGLVCYVPQANLSAYPILVGNPLTDEWKVLPCIALVNKETIMVQLVMEQDGKSYRVIVVCTGKFEEDISAHCYDSKIGEWSYMDSGLVYGGCSTLVWTIIDSPCVFDCATKILHELVDCFALEGVNAKRYAMVKDRLFVLHKWSSDMFPHVAKRFIVSEYAWQTSASDLSRLRIIDSTLPRDLPRDYEVHLFACNGFMILFADNCEEDEDQHQLIRLYDSSVNDWHSLSMGGDFRFTEDELQSVYMCELRWDAVP